MGCQEEPKHQPIIKTEKIQKKEIKKPESIQKKWDSLNRNNVAAFFTEYGKQNKETNVLISTKFGEIKLRLYNDTPIHRASFIFLSKINYFNTTVFYRIAKGFVIQGGNSDESYTQAQRNKYDNYLMEPEFRSNRKHKYGALAAARDYENNPNKLSSPFEFYIVQSKKGAHHLNNEHTVFGEVVSGFSALDKIAQVEVGPDEWPLIDIDMKVEVLD
ncbi:peptidyl-prolyl cis-trans isomerase [Polaribacter pacificus]|uniref:Peptidyl-prolyl cis-trans isomerase n=2 Tax=Polaribacter pacificus TaxID=1775173 RepID=A0A917MH66_9FLAO|nr:peptidyl-prolyl cis-trans isomerase [Polaribacter pacificus]